MKTVKVKNLEMYEFAAKKPVTMSDDGKTATLADVAKKPSLSMANLFSLEDKLQIDLTVQRYIPEPDFKLGVFEHGIMSKDEVIDAVKSQTIIGQQIVRAEMIYCQELMKSLDGEVPQAPKIPGIVPEPIPPYHKWIPTHWWHRWRFLRNTVLFCENTTDSVTRYAAAYRMNNVHPIFKKRGFNIVSLTGVNDDRYHFAEAIKKNTVTYISGVGHGSPTTYTGHLGSPVLKVGAYQAEEVKGKTIHLLSCQTAKNLGPDLVKNGARVYGGYFENFTFVYDQAGTTVDEMELFWKCDSTFDIMMASGATAESAHNTTIRRYNASIALPEVAGTTTATWLTHDRNYFRSPVVDAVYGKKEARIYPYVLIPGPRLETVEEMFDLSQAEADLESQKLETVE